MLAALLGFIIIGLFYCWWHLLKTFCRYKKGVDAMSVKQFYSFLFLNFGVVSFLTLSIYSCFPVHSQEYKWLWPYTDIIPVILQIIPLFVSYLIYKIYRKIKRTNTDIIIKTEDINL